ncbi:MAG TPA: UDP-N-acetylmuramoyl-L-alanine--D-glutamate ligase [Candidatus Corynebacterium gallistercoris]|uniref:UDP-N-acetylmuramoylalanine--D-glutamate ligase n=1 Tax=Candidatus Corynebacterium gallistercoris TaxID=2838530 RepID=A0A9D1RXW6_9CORY|nr:UDP-N-acetylmuramoyl-L-alanine--D-glutamate ligase [Candidatus Corynebacterium gallistercoris]
MSRPVMLSPNEAVELMRHDVVFLAGLGVAGRGVLTMLKAMGAKDVRIVDDRAPEATLTVAQAVESLHNQPPALLITSPGWRPDSPLLSAAAETGVPVIGDIEAAWLADQAGAFGAPRMWMAVTGTNGKTTTTAMLTAMMQADGRSAEAVGNIGTPPGVALTRGNEEGARVDVLVAEVSSFQLHWAPTFTPDVGCVLNLAEDHIDWHGSFAEYAADKAKVLTARYPVLALDEPEVMQLPAARAALEGPCWGFTAGAPVASHINNVVGVNAATLTHNSEPLASAEGISPPGPAGIADAAASAAMARAVNVKASAIAAALSSFQVQAHRGQVVATTGEVTWIDNSKATNPHAAEAALRGQDNVIWVAGGQLKGASVTELISKIAGGLKAAVVLGVDRRIIAAELARVAPTVHVDVIDETDPRGAMEQAVLAARQQARPGDIVILAPAAASLDMYTGMGQRGDLFAEFAAAGE